MHQTMPILAQFNTGGMGWGAWGVIGTVVGSVLGGFGAMIAWRRDRDLKKLDQEQRNRDDAIVILRDELKRMEERHKVEIAVLTSKVELLDRQLHAKTTDWAETQKQLNERILEVAALKVELGRSNLQRDEYHRHAVTLQKVLKRERDKNKDTDVPASPKA